jgi:hypothetical protein
MKKTLVGIAMALAVGSVSADKIDDIKAQGQKHWCHFIQTNVLFGARQRLRKIPLIFKSISADEENIPLDALYVIDLDSMTDNERKEVTGHISAGWTLMDKYLKRHKEEEAKWKFARAVALSSKYCVELVNL